MKNREIKKMVIWIAVFIFFIAFLNVLANYTSLRSTVIVVLAMLQADKALSKMDNEK